MPRKPTKGYYVRGQFVASGSELDQELRRELKGPAGASKTDLKKHSERLQKLGEAMLTLRPSLLARVRAAHEDLSDKLVDALDEARRITHFEGRRRQLQYIGKLMRGLGEDTVAAIEAALEEQRKPSAQETLRLHEAEQWRERLIADDAALAEWLLVAPATDVQRLRTLIRQARKDALAAAGEERPGQAARHGKAYRELFQTIRAALADTATDDGDTAPPT